MIIAEKLTYELHALWINYCRNKLAELPNVEIRKWKYRGNVADFCYLDGRKYVSTGIRGRELLPIGRSRERFNKALDILMAAWRSKYGNAEIPNLNPHLVTRAINSELTMDRKFFETVPAGMNKYKGSPDLAYKGVIYKSKSERDIARVYDELGIEIKYETPIYVNGILYTPDFCAFSHLTGRCFYHEHQGKMGDGRYRQDKEKSHRMYSEYGLIEGLDIIYTYEGAGIAFNPENLKYEVTSLIMRNLDCPPEQIT